MVAIAGCFGLAAMAPDEESSDNQSNDSGGSESNSNGGQSKTSESTKESTEQQNKESESGPEGTINEHDSVKVLNAKYDFKPFEGPVLEGKLENVTDEDLSQVEVQVHYFDSEETRLGESMDLVSDFAAGGTATFETIGGFDVKEKEISAWELTIKVIDL